MTRFVIAAALSGLAALATAPRSAAAQAAREVVCESRDKEFEYCQAPTNGSARVLRVMSDTPCLLNRTWGFDARGVWVDRGCRARFALGGQGGGWDAGDDGRLVTCESRNDAYEFCRARTRGDVRLARQLSRDPCLAGRSWGFQRDGIWVKDGCRAEFEVGYSEASWEDGDRQVRCESEDREYRRCRTWTYGQVRLLRQLSSSHCALNTSWGYDREGIWVDNGCRGVFSVGSDVGGGGWGNWEGGGNWNGNPDAWVKLQRRAKSACGRVAQERGFRNVSVKDADRLRDDDVSLLLIGDYGSRRYQLNCRFDARREQASIRGQTRF